MIILFRSAAGSNQVPYSPPSPPTDHVPSLSWICLQRLVELPEHINSLNVRLNYDANQSDVLEGPCPLDPRLWLTLVQIYDNLPLQTQTITLPLADIHLPNLQYAPSTRRFSLITILDLPACPHLTDTSIVQLKPLHSLAALDASATSLTPYGIKVLAGTLQKANDDNHLNGPWPLRILRLRYCQYIDNNVHLYLIRFPLLSAVDLRGTSCRPVSNSPFQPSFNTTLFHPSPLSAAMDMLSGPDLYSSQNIFKILINRLNYLTHPGPKSITIPQESYVFVPNLHDESGVKLDASAKAFELQLQHPRQQSRNSGKHIFNNSTKNRYDHEETEVNTTTADDPTLAVPALVPPNEDLIRQPEPGSRPHNNLPIVLRDSETSPESFYDEPTRLTPPTKYDPIKNYNAAMYYAYASTIGVSSNPHDTKLALYRPPPSWKLLELDNTSHDKDCSQSATSKMRETFPTVNRARMSFQIGRARMDALRQSTTKRSTMGEALSQRNESSCKQGKDPFRRHSTSALDQEPTDIKPLKPISSLEVPLLPSQHGQHAEIQGTATTPRTRTSTSKFGLRSSSFISSKEPMPRNKPINSTWAGLESSRAEKSVPHKIRVSGADASSHTTGSFVRPSSSAKPTRTAFDWGSWSKAGKK